MRLDTFRSEAQALGSDGTNARRREGEDSDRVVRVDKRSRVFGLHTCLHGVIPEGCKNSWIAYHEDLLEWFCVQHRPLNRAHPKRGVFDGRGPERGCAGVACTLKILFEFAM